MTEHDTRLSVSRRGFLAGATGLTLSFALPLPTGRAEAQGGMTTVNAFIAISPDGAIRIFAPAAEMGQGVQTGVPLIIAEEMDADWNDVVVETAPVDPALNNPIFGGQYTVASLTTKGYWTPARMAGAAARRVLMEAAAKEWGVDVSELSTGPSTVTGPGGRSATYGEIAAFAEPPETMPEIAPEELKPASEYRLLGNSRMRVDVAEKSDGRAKYGIDAAPLPNMVYATVVRAPAEGQSPASFNGDALKAMPGITDVVALPYGVAVVGESMPQVFDARRTLEAEWEGTPPGASIDSDADKDEYLSHLRGGREPDVVYSQQGDAKAALGNADRVVTGEYLSEYAYHAQMEPVNCTADVRADGADIWVGTQWQTMSQNKVTGITGLDPASIRVHQQYLGGGYGRRAHTEYVDDAVRLSHQLGRPVKMVLSREDDVASARMRPLTAQRIEMGLDPAGRITALRHVVACEPVAPYMYGQERWESGDKKDIISMRGSHLPHYDIPDQIAEQIFEMKGARTAAWRGIGEGYTKFALETMVDRVARDQGIDPIAYRLSMTSNPRVRAVLERVREMSDWSNLAEGRGKGVAFSEYGDSLAAAVAEVSVGEDGAIRVHNIWTVADPGLPLNPDAVEAQLEGAMVFGTSAALKEQMTVKDGAVQQSNYYDYPVLRMDETPEIAVAVIRGSDTPTEVGELGMPLPAPAIANAVRALNGAQLTHLPMTPERVKAAMQG